tara:strand:- start:1054 stop:1308 length:255 start_codon:yes stop_codon:yes gene_type:complete
METEQTLESGRGRNKRPKGIPKKNGVNGGQGGAELEEWKPVPDDGKRPMSDDYVQGKTDLHDLQPPMENEFIFLLEGGYLFETK